MTSGMTSDTMTNVALDSTSNMASDTMMNTSSNTMANMTADHDYQRSSGGLVFERTNRFRMALLAFLVLILLAAMPAAARADGLSAKKVKIYPGESTIVSLDSSASGKVKWKVSKKGIVKLKKEGKTCTIIGKKKGTVKLTAVIGKKKYSCKVVVKKLPKYQIKACDYGSTKSIGTTVKTYHSFWVTLKSNSGKLKKNWVWSSSDPSILELVQSENNSLSYRVKTYDKTGTVTITAKKGNKKAKLTITVVDRSEPIFEIQPTDYTDAYGNGGGPIGTRIDTDYSFWAYIYSNYTTVPEGGWTWKSSDPSILQITEQEPDGSVRLETPGKVGQVSLTASRGKYIAKINIHVVMGNRRAYWNTQLKRIYTEIGMSNAWTPQYKCHEIAKWLSIDADYYITDDDNMFSLLDNHYGQCMHYAYAFKYLAENAGITTLYVRNVDNSDSSNNHAWNEVLIGGKWFNIDVTNMDQIDGGDTEKGFLYYKGFFLVSDKAYFVKTGKILAEPAVTTTYDGWGTQQWTEELGLAS